MNDIIDALKGDFKKLAETEAKNLHELNLSIGGVQNELKQFESRWTGAWMRFDYNYYVLEDGQEYGVSDEYAYGRILERTGIDLRKTEKQIRNCVKVFKNYNNTVISDLSWIKDDDKYAQEAQLLEQLEKFEWGVTINDAIALYRPNNLIVYDTDQLNRAPSIPPHIVVTADYLTQETKCSSCNKYGDLVKRLLRQIEIKIGSKKADTSETILTTIFENFHQFATTLRNRYNGRRTVEIKDEYDVQDLIHALLKIHFRDVRPEEYTPSYGGRATRMDFLLKNERVVIEVKKTRNNLKDKDISEQLILDVAHYKNHPDCAFLYCFVYDPESQLRNPVGLENDLSKLSSDSLVVKVFIKP